MLIKYCMNTYCSKNQEQAKMEFLEYVGLADLLIDGRRMKGNYLVIGIFFSEMPVK